jgi:hypothetical protein
MQIKKALGLECAWVLALLGMLGSVAPALACTCAWIESWEAYARKTEFIFTGKAKAKTDMPARTDSSGGGL